MVVNHPSRLLEFAWLAFLLSGLIPLLSTYGWEDLIADNPLILQAALIPFEIAAPSAMLVASVVTYAIWPQMLKKGPQATAVLKLISVLLMHNANVLMVLCEVGLIGKIPFQLSHISVAPIFGIFYIFFTWFMTMRWSPQKGCPQFIYFFLDTTLGWTTTIALITLLVVLLSFYVLFFLAQDALEHTRGLVWRLGVISVILYVVCRFKD